MDMEGVPAAPPGGPAPINQAVDIEEDSDLRTLALADDGGDASAAADDEHEDPYSSVAAVLLPPLEHRGVVQVHLSGNTIIPIEVYVGGHGVQWTEGITFVRISDYLALYKTVCSHVAELCPGKVYSKFIKNLPRDLHKIAMDSTNVGSEYMPLVEAHAHFLRLLQRSRVERSQITTELSPACLSAVRSVLDSFSKLHAAAADVGGASGFALSPWSNRACTDRASFILVAITYALVAPTYPDSNENPPITFLKVVKPLTLYDLVVHSGFKTLGEIIHRNERRKIHQIVARVERPKWITQGSMLPEKWGKERLDFKFRSLARSAESPVAFKVLHILALPGPETDLPGMCVLNEVLWSLCQSLIAYAAASKERPCVTSRDGRGDSTVCEINIAPIVVPDTKNVLWTWANDMINEEILEQVPRTALDTFVGETLENAMLDKRCLTLSKGCCRILLFGPSGAWSVYSISMNALVNVEKLNLVRQHLCHHSLAFVFPHLRTSAFHVHTMATLHPSGAFVNLGRANFADLPASQNYSVNENHIVRSAASTQTWRPPSGSSTDSGAGWGGERGGGGAGGGGGGSGGSSRGGSGEIKNRTGTQVGIPRIGVSGTGIDNSCFINGVLCCIRGSGPEAVDSFMHCLQSAFTGGDALLPTQKLTARAIWSLLKECKSATRSSDLLSAARACNRAVRSDANSFADFERVNPLVKQRQEDASAFLVGINGTYFTTLTGLRLEHILTCNNCKATRYHTGGLDSCIHLTIADAFGGADQEVTLQSLIDDYVHAVVEVPEGEEGNCPSLICAGVPGSSLHKLSSFMVRDGSNQPPEFLWFFISRFHFLDSKPVKLQTKIRLGKSVTVPFRLERAGVGGHEAGRSEPEQVEYTLNGYVEHIGPSPHAGHFYAYTRDPKRENSEDWFLFNDAEVRTASWTEEVEAGKGNDIKKKGGRPFLVLCHRTRPPLPPVEAIL